jgi:hypothetical protein
LQGSPGGEARREGLVADTGMLEQPKIDVNTAIALLKMRTIAIEELGRQDSKKDKEAFYKAIAKVQELKRRIATMPPLVVQAATKSMERDSKSTTKKVEGSDPEEIDFQELHAAFKKYRQAETLDDILYNLNEFQSLAMNWVNNYQHSRNVKRLDAVIQITDLATEQIKSGARAQAGQIYLNAILGSGKSPLQAISTTSVQGVKDNVWGKGEQGGLSEAQIAALRIFSGPDYGYINPSIEGNRDWLEANKRRADAGKFAEEHRVREVEKEKKKKGERVTPLTEEQLDEIMMGDEGRLHAGFVDDALESLPVYPGTVYRGWAISELDFLHMEALEVYEFKTPTSTSKTAAVARTFASSREAKPIEVLAIIENHGGRDTSQWAERKREDEVMIRGGTRFTVSDIKEMPDKTHHGGAKYEMKFTGLG